MIPVRFSQLTLIEKNVQVSSILKYILYFNPSKEYLKRISFVENPN